MTPSRIFLYFCLSFIAGIFVNSLIFISQLLTLGFLIFGILLISVFWRDKRFVVAGFCILFLVAGIYRHQTVSLSRTVLNSDDTLVMSQKMRRLRGEAVTAPALADIYILQNR